MRILLLVVSLIPLFIAALQAKDSRYEISQLLLNREFSKLDELYQQVAKGPFQLTDFTPPLYQYFMSLTPYAQSGQWNRYEKLMQEWQKEHPESRAAVLALAQVYHFHAWDIRGTGYASSVTAESWEQYHKLMQQSSTVLMQHSDKIHDELWYYYSVARTFANSGDNFDQAIEMYMALIQKWPGFMEAYTELARFLLPRWHGNPATLVAFVEWAAEHVEEISGDGDLLYAKLMTETAHMEQAVFMSAYQPDMERIHRGFDAMIDRLSLDDRNDVLNHYIRTLHLTQDYEERLKAALLRRGPVPFVQPWSNRKNYWKLMQRCGAESAVRAAWELEKKGDLAQAEALYRSFDPNPEMNQWLSQFYQRHRKRELLANREDTRYLSDPVAQVGSLNDMFALCFIYPTTGDYTKAKEAAARFDAERGHNLAGKLAYYQVALYEGDQQAAARARQSILDLKTDRKWYQVAQEFLRNPDPAPLDLDSLDWSERYADHALIAIALYLYELERIEEAKALLEEGAFQALSLSSRNRCAGLYLYPPQ